MTNCTNGSNTHRKQSETTDEVITVATAIITNAEGSVLTVRKRDSSFWILPGGKPEEGESKKETLIRELKEELSVSITNSSLQFRRIAFAPAANEHNTDLLAYVYSCRVSEPIRVSGEIAEAAWINPLHPVCKPGTSIAPLLLSKVFPTLSRKINSIAVYCGASVKVDQKYHQIAATLGETLGRKGITLIYGGGKVGLMGTLADSALTAGGTVIGVMPTSLINAEIAHKHVTQLVEVNSMAERKEFMINQADAFIALPGGSGTLDELFETWTLQQLGSHDKPIALMDSEFWNEFMNMAYQMCEKGFIRREDIDCLTVHNTPTGILQGLESSSVPSSKWR